MAVTGDIPVFFAQLKDGAPLTAGSFMTGRFPTMMFALPALILLGEVTVGTFALAPVNA